MGLFKGRLIAVLAFTLVWSSVQCVASCANEPSAGPATASTEPPCHHHPPNGQTPASCSNQQLPQADGPRPLPELTSNASLAAIDAALVSYLQIPLLTAVRAVSLSGRAIRPVDAA